MSWSRFPRRSKEQQQRPFSPSLSGVAQSSEYTAARAALLDRLDAIADALADGALSAARVAALDNLDALVSTRTTGITSGQLLVRPIGSDGVDVNGSFGAWTYTAWTEIVAAGVVTSHALSRIEVSGGTNVINTEVMEFQLAHGAAGAEVIMGTWRVVGLTTANAVTRAIELAVPISVAANARVAARIRDASGNNSMRFFALDFVPRPL